MYVLFVIVTAPLWIPAFYLLIKDGACKANHWGKHKKKRRRRK